MNPTRAKPKKAKWITLFFLTAWLANLGHAEVRPDLSQVILEAEKIAQNEVIVAAVKSRNADTPKLFATMTQTTWTTLSANDPIIREIIKSLPSQTLKSLVKPYITEAFVSAANGSKVAFISKTTNWSHRGKEKHEFPMKGKTWQGKMEFDESSGVNQIQISVPIKDQGQPIGSLVLGVSIVKWERTPK